MDEDWITLPSAEEIIKRLRTVINEPNTVANLYPKIAQYAGEVKPPEGVELMVRLAICDYAVNYPGAVTAVLDIAVPRFVAALSKQNPPS